MSHHPGDFRTWEMLTRQKSERLQRENARRIALGIDEVPGGSLRAHLASALRGMADRVDRRQPEPLPPEQPAYKQTSGPVAH